MSTKSYSIRIDDELLNKIHVVSHYEGRSLNSQVNILIRKCVDDFEEQHGTIKLGTKKNPANR